MKQGQIVTYHLADNDPSIADANGQRTFPAIITQIVHQSSEADEEKKPTCVHLGVFAWNGYAPVLHVNEIGEGFDVNAPRPVGLFSVPGEDVSGMGEFGSELIDSIRETNQKLEEHSKSFAESNQQTLEAVRADNKVVTEMMTGVVNRISNVEELVKAQDEKIAALNPKKK